MQSDLHLSTNTNPSNTSEHDSELDRSMESNSNAFDLCVHMIDRSDESVESVYANAEDNLSLEECLIIIQDKVKKAMNNITYKCSLEGENIDSSIVLEDYIKSPDSELYVFYDGIKPIIKEVEKELVYESIHKYSYLDEKKYVKIYVPLDQIGNVPADKISSRFLDRSFQIKIHDYKGKNWIFAVPKTQCQILTKESKVTIKKDKLIVSLGKMAENDNWFTLHKTKCIGEKEMD